jgi:hypothetical protein
MGEVHLFGIPAASLRNLLGKRLGSRFYQESARAENKNGISFTTCVETSLLLFHRSAERQFVRSRLLCRVGVGLHLNRRAAATGTTLRAQHSDRLHWRQVNDATQQLRELIRQLRQEEIDLADIGVSFNSRNSKNLPDRSYLPLFDAGLAPEQTENSSLRTGGWSWR